MCRVWDHPRMRGEKCLGFVFVFLPKGSPPHARGKAWYFSIVLARSGITPACAGKSAIDRHIHTDLQDHPRMRGEKKSTALRGLVQTGSPPHARGKVYCPPHCLTACRITPACAGKREAIFALIVFTQDHPRMRGEKYGLHGREIVRPGSPPHARGKD